MPNPDRPKLPALLSDMITDMITQDGDHGDAAQWLLAVRMAEKVEIPTGHDKIIEAINHGQEVLVSMIEHQVTMTVAKLQIEAADKAMKDAEEKLASEPPSDKFAETEAEDSNLKAKHAFFAELEKLSIEATFHPTGHSPRNTAILKLIDDFRVSSTVTSNPGLTKFCQNLRDMYTPLPEK